MSLGCFLDSSCRFCERVTMAALRSHLSPSSRGWEGHPLPLPFQVSLIPAEASALGDLKVTIRASLPSQPPQTFYHLSQWPPSPEVDTITQTGAPSTRQAYALKWSLFAVHWCSSRWEDPRRCSIKIVFSFLQERLEHRLKVHVATITVQYDAVDGWSLGKHVLIVRSLRGARR